MATPNTKEYNFVTKPDPDFFCPVNFEVLLHPRQTSCCGHHLSKEAVTRLSRDRAPCPLCKTRYFTAHADKYFKRKVAEVKVFCHYKEQGCNWTGELGTLAKHTSSCSKRLWNCNHCNLCFDQHKAQCPMALISCPNNCDESVSFSRNETGQHRLVCPLEVVGCKFYGVVCDVKLPRREMAKHLEEKGLMHLMDATIHNFKLTAEIQQDLKEKGREIASLQQNIVKLESSLQQLEGNLAESISQESLKLNDHIKERVESCETKCDECLKALLSFSSSDLVSTRSEGTQTTGETFHTYRLTLQKYAQAKGHWDSDKFICQGYNFCLRISLEGTHLSASLCVKEGKSDSKLKWNVHCAVHVQLLNQLGNHDHKSIAGIVWLSRPRPGPNWSLIGKICENNSRILCGSHRTNVTYLKDDTLSFHVDVKIV